MSQHRVAFDVTVSTETYASNQPGILGEPVRIFFLNVTGPAERRMMVSTIFNGPNDPNFFSLVAELKVALDRVLDHEESQTESEMEIHSDPETSYASIDLSTGRKRRKKPKWRRNLDRYRTEQARRDLSLFYSDYE